MAELTYFSTFFVVYLSKIYTGKVVSVSYTHLTLPTILLV